MPKIHSYRKFNPESFEAKILDVEDSKFYKEVLNKAKKDLPKGHKYISNGINAEKAEGSNFFFVCLADKVRGKGERIPTMNDWNDMLSGGNFARRVYFDSNQLALRSKTASWNPNQHLINDLTRKLNGTTFKGAKFNEFTPQNPLVITGAKLRQSKAKDNHYGLILSLDDATFEYDPRLAHGKDKIELGGQPKKLWTKENGVSRLCLGRDVLSSGNVDLSDSYSYGRVAFIDAEGVQDSSGIPMDINKITEEQALTKLRITPEAYKLIKELQSKK